MVIASLVLGILGMAFGIAGTVLGIVALGRVHAVHGEVRMLQEEVESLTNRLITAVAEAAVAHAQAEEVTFRDNEGEEAESTEEASGSKTDDEDM